MFKFKHPFTCLISGPTQSGKTHFSFELLKNIHKMIDPVPTRVIWCYGEEQEKLKELPDYVTLVEGLEGIQEIDKNAQNLLILDDLMHEAGENKEVAELFTKGSHHRNLSVIMIVQNVFHQGKIMRTISLDAHYMIIFKNPRDASQIRCLANQLFPGKGQFLVESYKQATSRPHGYLLLDLTQSTLDNRRVLSDILPVEEGYYYIPK
jgi:hypothetical protein